MPTSTSFESEDRQREEQRDDFVEKLTDACAGTFEILTLYIGVKLGFYEVLADHGPMTSTELARATNTDERYTREWLEQQTVAGILRVEDETAESKKRRYDLPAGHADVLADRDGPFYMAPIGDLLVSTTRPLDDLLEAFHTGDGVPYHAYGTDAVEGIGEFNRPAFLHRLGREWIPAIRDLDERLQSDPPARVADIGCGVGWSSLSLAKSYPNIRVDGFDLDEESIQRARRNAEDARLSGRVRFHRRNAAEVGSAGNYDLVMAIECVHDMARPVQALRAMRLLAGEDGTVLVVDQRVEEEFTAAGNDVEWMMYGFSVLHCLPVGRSERPSAATGTVMRPGTLRSYAREAGFSAVEVLPIEDQFWRFCRLRP